VAINNFIVLDSHYGKFIVNRHCDFQAEALAKTGLTHIEPELTNMRAIWNTLESGCLMVDGGANIGFVAIPAAIHLRAKGGKVIAFEPQRMLFNALAGSIALNDLDNVFIHRKGLSDQLGLATLPEINYGAASDFGQVALSDEVGGYSEPIAMRDRQVALLTLDSLNLPRLDFFKLDVEGFEVAALKGAINSIRNYRPWLWVECWLSGEDAIKATLSAIPDYIYVRVDQLNMLCAPREKLEASGIKLLRPKG
jgi:FkbM family methyltransferase